MTNKQVLRWAESMQVAITQLLCRYQLSIEEVALDKAIPGSFWGEDEAGLIGNALYVRPDTPVHSLLHEACHWICMTPERRQKLHTDAGGTDIEECAVCYLQVLLAAELGISQAHFFADMDTWGYSFRLGSAEQWFKHDAEDAAEWLLHYGLITQDYAPSFNKREFNTT